MYVFCRNFCVCESYFILFIVYYCFRCVYYYSFFSILGCFNDDDNRIREMFPVYASYSSSLSPNKKLFVPICFTVFFYIFKSIGSKISRLEYFFGFLSVFLLCGRNYLAPCDISADKENGLKTYFCY